jgi:hypothetical protein
VDQLLGLIVIPIIVSASLAVLLRSTVSLKEATLQIVGVCLLMAAAFFIARRTAMSSVEHLHGRITDKTSGSQQCCHCRDVCTSRDKKGRCTSSQEVCSHVRDYWWSLETTLGTIPIDRCERSYNVPPEWAHALVGEPATRENSYTNYLKADPESLFRHDFESPYRRVVPAYPAVYDYYKVNPVITDGPAVPPSWQAAFREINANLGPTNQVDVTVLLTRVQDPAYAQAVEAAWLYGPKNSMTLVLGISADVISWARVVSISRIEDLEIELRDTLRGKPLDDNLPAYVGEAVRKKFRRTAMAEFEYLASAVKVPTGWLVVLYVLGIALSFGCSTLMHHHDVFGDGPVSRYRSSNPFKKRLFR